MNTGKANRKERNYKRQEVCGSLREREPRGRKQRKKSLVAMKRWRLTVLLVEQDLELVGEVVVQCAVHALHRLLLRQLAIHPRASEHTRTPSHTYTN